MPQVNGYEIEPRSDLYKANLPKANLPKANLFGANLFGADLSGANLSGANLSGADLYGANLSRANLSGVILSGANLYGANLSRANLSGADLSGANLSGAKGIIDGGHNVRGHRFIAYRPEGQKDVWFKGGCRTWKSYEEAMSHYDKSYETLHGESAMNQGRRIITYLSETFLEIYPQ